MSGDFILLEDLLQDLPTEGSERQQRLQQIVRELKEFVGHGERSLPPYLQEIALRLTRDALFDLWQGFRLGVFRGVSSIPRQVGEPPAGQIRLRERLEGLAHVEAARAEMFRWFLAGLHHELRQILPEQLRRLPPTRNPGQFLTRGIGWMALVIERSFRTPIDDQNPEHEFGLYGLHLLFTSTRKVRDQEFKALDNLMTRWVGEYPYFPDLQVRDLVRAIALADLTVEQVRQLENRLLSWHDLERHPAERAFASERAAAQAWAKTKGYGWAMTAIAGVLALLLRPRSRPNLFGEGHQRYREEVNRYWTLGSALASLALQDEYCLPALAEEIDRLLEMRANVDAKFVLMDTLPAFLAYPHRLVLLQEVLGKHSLKEFDQMWLDDLSDLHLRVSKQGLEALLDLLRRFPDVRWPLQILENVGELAPQAEEWLARQVQDGGDNRLIEVAQVLHRRLSVLRAPSVQLEHALRQRLVRSLNAGLPVPDALIHQVLEMRDEVLRRLLRDLARQLEDGSLPITPALSAFLRALAAQVNHTERLNPIKLAACWMIDPEDILGSGLPLAERLAQAAHLLLHRQFDGEVAALLSRAIPQETSTLVKQDSWGRYPVDRQVVAVHPRLASVLLEPISHRQEYPMRAGADRRLALARALGYASSPEKALPLLAELFQIAVEMHTAWSEAGGEPRFFPELAWESDALVLDTLKAVVQLEPVLPQAIALLEEILLSEYHMPEGGFSGPTLSVATITQEILPLIVGRRLAPEAIPALVALLEHSHPPKEKHKQRIWQCALQWLSNTSALSAEQQQVIWNVGYTSPLILTRALALLVLGRQRPLSQRTLETVLGLLRRPWRQLYRDRSAEIARLSDRDAWLILSPGDVFLLAGVAVALTAEWAAKTDWLTDDQRSVVRQAWIQTSSDLNRSLEARLAESTHPLTGKDWSSAKGLALTLCNAVGKSPGDDPDWLARPADLAGNLLLMTR